MFILFVFNYCIRLLVYLVVRCMISVGCLFLIVVISFGVSNLYVFGSKFSDVVLVIVLLDGLILVWV